MVHSFSIPHSRSHRKFILGFSTEYTAAVNTQGGPRPEARVQLAREVVQYSRDGNRRLPSENLWFLFSDEQREGQRRERGKERETERIGRERQEKRERDILTTTLISNRGYTVVLRFSRTTRGCVMS